MASDSKRLLKQRRIVARKLRQNPDVRAFVKSIGMTEWEWIEMVAPTVPLSPSELWSDLLGVTVKVTYA